MCGKKIWERGLIFAMLLLLLFSVYNFYLYLTYEPDKTYILGITIIAVTGQETNVETKTKNKDACEEIKNRFLEIADMFDVTNPSNGGIIIKKDCVELLDGK